MSRQTHDKNRKVWSGYECPACFAVFRVPKGNEHRPVYCPGCDAILRLSDKPVKTVLPSPEGDEPVAPVPERPDAGEDAVAEDSEPGLVKKKRRRRKLAPADEIGWDRNDKSKRRKVDPLLPLFLLLSVVVFAGVFLGLGWLLDEPEEKAGQSAGGDKEVLVIAHDQEPDELVIEEEPIGELSSREGEVHKAVRSFFQATTVDELVKTIRKREAIEDAVRRYYEKHPYQPAEVHAIAEDGVLGQLDAFVSVNVTMEDYSVKPIALEWRNGRFLVDWESWVGYSEFGWAEFMDQQPLRSRLFRVVARPVEYYNFAFSNDRKWRSFELSVPGETVSLYGYVEAGSALERELTPLDPGVLEGTYVVLLRYPEEPQTRNQVLIEKVVASGWVVGE